MSDKPKVYLVIDHVHDRDGDYDKVVLGVFSSKEGAEALHNHEKAHFETVEKRCSEEHKAFDRHYFEIEERDLEP